MTCLVYCVYFLLLGFFIGIARGRHLELATIGRLQLVALDNCYRLRARGREIDSDQEAVEIEDTPSLIERYQLMDYTGKRWQFLEAKQALGM